MPASVDVLRNFLVTHYVYLLGFAGIDVAEEVGGVRAEVLTRSIQHVWKMESITYNTPIFGLSFRLLA
jgi:hypothetical protein